MIKCHYANVQFEKDVENEQDMISGARVNFLLLNSNYKKGPKDLRIFICVYIFLHKTKAKNKNVSFMSIFDYYFPIIQHL